MKQHTGPLKSVAYYVTRTSDSLSTKINPIVEIEVYTQKNELAVVFYKVYRWESKYKLSLSKILIYSIEKAIEIEVDNAERFFVQSSNEDNISFLNRQKSVFGKLDAVAIDTEREIENKNKHSSKDIIKKETSNRKQRIDTRQFRGQESIFKRPEAPIPSRFKKDVPDFKRHPHKWTKYTLSDVSAEDMSDRSNTAAAMMFLQQLQSKKETHIDLNKEEKITFKKPKNQRRPATEETSGDKFESPSFRSSKVVMPEYVIGAKKTNKKPVSKSVEKAIKHKEIKLDHLNDEDVY